MQVWFQNRRAKFRKTERMTQQTGVTKNNEDSNGNRTPGSPENEKSDQNDISIENIKEEKAHASHLQSHGSPLMDQMNDEGGNTASMLIVDW